MRWATICYAEVKKLASGDRVFENSLGELTFADSEVALPLQAADLIAYAAHNWAKEANGNQNHPVDPIYMRALRHFRTQDDFWLYDARRMAHLKKIFRLMD